MGATVPVGNAWGANPNVNLNPAPNVWGVAGRNTVGVVRVDGGANGLGVQDIPPAYDGRREQVERFGAGGKI